MKTKIFYDASNEPFGWRFLIRSEGGRMLAGGYMASEAQAREAAREMEDSIASRNYDETPSEVTA